jgi:predicted secreted Zn-dependent protease
MKTAVEWLFIKTLEITLELENKKISHRHWEVHMVMLLEQAKEMEKRLKHESIERQVAILKYTLDEMMTGFDSEEDRMDFILDICNGYKKRIETKQQEQ